MITASDLERIQSLPQDQSVLMAVVHVNPADQENHGDALTTRVRSALSDLGVSGSVLDVSASPDGARLAVLNDSRRAFVYRLP